MPTAVRTVTFTVHENSIAPTAPQWAGIQGEHQATRVVFELLDSWSRADYRYRVEWIDGMQAFFTSDFLTADDEGISLLLPAAWTAAGGTGEIRLAASLNEGTGDMGQTVYSMTGRLTFSNRDEGIPGIASAASSLDFLLSEAQRALNGLKDAAAVTTAENSGLITFGGKAALAYGVAVSQAGRNTEISLPCSFSDVYYVQAGTDTAVIPILSRTHTGFTIHTDQSYSTVYWMAVGTLYEE